MQMLAIIFRSLPKLESYLQREVRGTKLQVCPPAVSGPGMRLVIGALKSFCCQMSINLSRDQMRVAKKLLHAAQIGARVQQVCRVTMAQFVGRQRRVQTGQRQVFFQTQLQISG